MSLYSKRFSGIEIENDGRVFLIREENSSLVSYISTTEKEFNFKGNITSNSITFNENSGSGNDKIILKAPSILSDNYTLTLPIDDGNTDEFLKTDGSGILSWGPSAGGDPGGIDNSIQLKSGTNFTGSEKLLFDGTTLTLSHSSLINNGQIFISPNYDHSGDVYDLDGSATDTVHIGRDSGLNLAKINSIGLGLNTGKETQGEYAIAIGNSAGETTQGDNSVAIGYEAGFNNQKENSIAIGTLTGFTTQGTNSIAIGNLAGNDKQKDFSIAIGISAGTTIQGENAVAIGRSAGSNNQGDNSVAIGYLAGGASQIANSIILNASGLDLVSANSGLFIDPITNDTNNATNILFYDSSTKEIKYDSSSLISGAISKPAPFTVGSNSITLNIANILSGVLRRNMTAIGTWTLPTSALSAAAISGVSVNDAIDFYIVNENTAGINDITLAIGTGGTMIGNVIIPSASITGSMELSSGYFRMQFTNVGVGTETYNCFRLS